MPFLAGSQLMAVRKNFHWYKKLMIVITVIFLSAFIILLIFVDRFVEPILKDRIHTLIVQGSDSLYTYHLGKLKANFFGGNVEIQDLEINVDSIRYNKLRSINALPSLTMQVNLQRGRIKGLGIFSLLFLKKINVQEIMSADANIRLSRHIHPRHVQEATLPLWEAIQPKIKSIYVDRIRLEGIKLLYKNADTSESVKLQFDRCDALFKDIRIDSASFADTTRVGFTKSIDMKFRGLKFRTEDSLYKMKAKEIVYSSTERKLEIDSFKLQPTLEKEDFYKKVGEQASMYRIEFQKVRFVNTHLDHFIHNNIIDADSAIFIQPAISIYNDRSEKINYESKIGKYPQQQLLKAASTILIKNLVVQNADIDYTEKNPVNMKEGTFTVSHMNMNAANITNDSATISRQPVCTAKMQGAIMDVTPFSTEFRFYLDTTNGKYDAKGTVGNITASTLNLLAVPLANVKINSINLRQLNFQVSGEDYEATSNVRMLYNRLSITLRKTNEETGETSTKKFLTKVINKFVIWPDNPGPDGTERVATKAQVARLTTQSFFGLFWKAIFAGMQDVMMKSGRYQ